MSVSCLKWVGFEDAADTLGVSSRVLRKYAGEQSNNPFPFEEQRGRMVTQCGPAYEWLAHNGKCQRLKRPADYDEWKSGGKTIVAPIRKSHSSVEVTSTSPGEPYFHDLECRLYNAAKRYFAEFPEREALKALRSYLAIELDMFKMLDALQEPKDLDVKFPAVLSSTLETMAKIIGVDVDQLHQVLKKSQDGPGCDYSGKPSELVPPGNVLYHYFQGLGDDPTDPDFEFSNAVESGAAPVPLRKNPDDKNEGLAIVLGMIQMRLGMWEASEGLPAVQRYIDRELKKEDVTQ